MNNTVAVYVGDKTNTDSEVDKAGLTNGTLKFVKVNGAYDASGSTIDELSNTTTRATSIVSGTGFTLSDAVTDPNVTTFSRPEDGAWADARTFYFVTTDRLDNTDFTNTQQGGTRLWKLNFNEDYTGGTIDVVVDTANWDVAMRGPKPNMFDNISVNADGTITLQEDVGNAEHNGKMWQYSPITGNVTMLSKFDPALFGDIEAGVFTSTAATFHTKDEETSGVIDVTRILGREDDKRYNLLVAQDHALAADTIVGGVVTVPGLISKGFMSSSVNAAKIFEGGQLLLMSRKHKSEHEHEDEDEDHDEHEHHGDRD